MTDRRNQLAKCRDEWMLSREGCECQDGITSGVYLRNRLERAYIAGWKARGAQAATHTHMFGADGQGSSCYLCGQAREA